MSAQAEGSASSKLDIVKTEEGDISLLRFRGQIDENFSTKETVGQVKKTVILDLGQVSRITSFGIRQWSEFLTGLQERHISVYAIDCSPRMVDNANMVVDFFKNAQIISFMAPYVCDACGEQHNRILDMIANRDEIITKSPKPEPCPCGQGQFQFDDDPETYFGEMAKRRPPQFSEQVASFLARSLDREIVHSARRTKVQKSIVGKYTLIRVYGDLDETFPSSKLAEGLEGEVLFDLDGVRRIVPQGRALWRQLIAQIRHTTTMVRIFSCPPGLLLDLVPNEDLRSEEDIVSISLPYRCDRCQLVCRREIGLKDHQKALANATAPQLRGENCTNDNCEMHSTAEARLLLRASALPATELPPELSSVIDEGRKIEEAESQSPDASPVAYATSAPTVSPTMFPTATPSSSGSNPILWIIGIMVAIAFGGVAIALILPKMNATSSETTADTGALTSGLAVETSHPEPPDWKDKTFYPEEENIFAVAQSALASEKGPAFSEARNAALEELIDQIGLGIRDARWQTHIAPIYKAARRQHMLKLEEIRLSGNASEISRERQAVAQIQEQVATLLVKTAGHIARNDAPDYYWQRTRAHDGSYHYRVWARVKMTKEGVRRLVDYFTAVEESLGGKIMTLFPSIAWRHNVEGGVVVIDLEPQSELRHLGLRTGDLIVSVQNRPIKDANDFKRIIEQEVSYLERTGGIVKILAKRADADIVPHNLHVEKKTRKKRDGEFSTEKPAVNIWDEDPNR